MIKKAVVMRKHLEVNRKDKDGKFRLILVESRIHRLARYYKVRRKPELLDKLLCKSQSVYDQLPVPAAACEEVGPQLEVRIIHCFGFGCIGHCISS